MSAAEQRGQRGGHSGNQAEGDQARASRGVSEERPPQPELPLVPSVTTTHKLRIQTKFRNNCY